MGQLWEKLHSRGVGFWKNFPNLTTPLNQVNLNEIEYELNGLDDRVLTLDNVKLDQSVGNTMVKDVTFNTTTGIITVKLLNGGETTYDTKLTKMAVNFVYDSDPKSEHYESLVITLQDGTKQYIDMSTLITQFEFTDTTTIGFTVDTDGKVSASVKNGSITSDKLEPNYLANVTTQANKAETNSKLAESWAVGSTGKRTGEDTNNAKYYSEQAKASAEEAASFKPVGYDELVSDVADLKEDMENVPTISDEYQEGNSIPRDADTLGGRITAEDVEKSFAPNYTRILYPFTEVADTNPISYVATENCWVVANLYGYNDKKGFCRIDDVITNMCSCSNTTIVLMRELIPLRKGQTITFYTEYPTLKTSFTIYGC